MKNVKLGIFLLVLIVGFASAQVYKWVDEEGRVYFSDKPPEQSEAEELVIPEGPSEEEIEAANEELRRTLESRKARDAIESSAEADKGSVKQSAQDLECVKIVYQLNLLGQTRRVFKAFPDGSRLYLSDADRPAEVKRLQLLKTHVCGQDSDKEREMALQVRAYSKALGRYCASMRDKLHAMQNPESRTQDSDLEEQRKLVERECPEVSADGLWLGDWIIVGRRHR